VPTNIIMANLYLIKTTILLDTELKISVLKAY